MPLITIFSAPKPFANPHISMIQRNAIQSWKMLEPDVEVILLGEEIGLAEAAREIGVYHIPEIERNADGTPLISSMFARVKEAAQGDLLAIVNADILLMRDFVVSARSIKDQCGQYMIMGHRWDLDVTAPLKFGQNWQNGLLEKVTTSGRLHKSKGSDYFIFPKNAFPVFPSFAIGRAGWDNWTIYHARKQGWQVIDATEAITVVHQQHDYHHLPGGKIHYTLPESDANMKIAGGKRHIFTLMDANRRLDKNGSLHPLPLNPVRIRREMEIFPILKWDHPAINDLFFYIFHPKKFIRHKFPGLAKLLGIRGRADEMKDD